MVMSHQTSNGSNSPNVIGDGNRVNIIDFSALSQRSAREVTSISKLIGVICKEANALSKGKNTSHDSLKDPSLKIEVRFSDYKKEIKSRYSRKHELYGDVYEVIIEEIDLTDTSLSEIGQYLEDISQRFLREESNDPIKALDRLILHFERELKQIYNDEEFSLAAIEYYLLKQLINCNVFPNPLK